MSIIFEERPSDLPYIETITRGHTISAGSTIRPSEIHWHMIFVKHTGRIYPFVVGPLTMSGVVSWGEGAEILWIKFKLGTFMPHLPIRKFLDIEVALPETTGQSFWLKSAQWQLPDYSNVETFVRRLVHDEILVYDPVVNAALQDQLPPQAISPRTVRHRFLQATGLPQSRVRQMKRAQQAMALLEQGVSILDTVFELGYYDQSHLTRSLKQFIGYTPATIIQLNRPA